jgi:hypothetical protein
MNWINRLFAALIALTFLVLPAIAMAVDIESFEGTYRGEVEILVNGETVKRDLSTTIEPTGKGFVLSWTSVTYRSDGRVKERTYEIEFVPSDRENIYQSAMKSNLFGKKVPLDPLQGEPFVWSRIEGSTLSVFSLYIDEVGQYEVQEFHRTRVDAGLDLVFRRLRSGQTEREIRALLVREE